MPIGDHSIKTSYIYIYIYLFIYEFDQNLKYCEQTLLFAMLFGYHRALSHVIIVYVLVRN